MPSKAHQGRSAATVVVSTGALLLIVAGLVAACAHGEATLDAKPAACTAGTELCDNQCVDTQTDSQHCGACGNACAPGLVCSAGQCGAECAGGTTNCGGACIDAQTDENNCGVCGNACTPGAICTAGQCGADCSGGTTDCGGTCVDTQTDADNCGGCGATCDNGQSCVGGQCTSCSDGQQNGAETDTDCGGPVCSPCASGLGCQSGADCVSTLCDTGVCIPCQSITDCSTGFNCVAGACAQGVESCAAQKSSYGSADGEYWLINNNTPSLVYCDMQLEAPLCAESQGEHAVRTREGSSLDILMTSVLDHIAGTCEMWAVRGANDGYPVDALNQVSGQTMTTCEAFGFVADDAYNNCSFGSSYSNCGFNVSPLHRYGNNCSGCQLNNGQFPTYVLQGPMSSAGVLSDVSGSHRLRCKIR